MLTQTAIDLAKKINGTVLVRQWAGETIARFDVSITNIDDILFFENTLHSNFLVRKEITYNDNGDITFIIFSFM